MVQGLKYLFVSIKPISISQYIMILLIPPGQSRNSPKALLGMVQDEREKRKTEREEKFVGRKTERVRLRKEQET